MIINFYKNIGESMNQVISRLKKEYNINETITYTGRLDPLACGNIIFLTGNDIYKQEEFYNKSKIYKTNIIHDIQTDSFDILGLISSYNIFNNKYENIQNYEYQQEYPMFSSYKIKGKPLWYYYLNNIKIDKIPSKKITLYDATKINEYKITKNDLLDIINNKLNLITDGNFRIDEIKHSWNNINKNNNLFTISQWKFTISSGGFIRYLANQMNGTCFDIERLCYNI